MQINHSNTLENVSMIQFDLFLLGAYFLWVDIKHLVLTTFN